MPLVQPGPFREKLILFGPPKVGKTTAHLSIAKAAADSGDERRFWYLDTDDAMSFILSSPEYSGINAEFFEAFDWPEYVEFSKKVMAQAQPGDFIVIDMIDKAWSSVQRYYLDAIEKKSPDQFLLEQKSKGKSGWQLYQQIDWGVVNALYDAFMKPLLLRSKAHIILVSEEKAVGDQDDKQKKLMFKDTKPAGQKSLPYQVRTILHLNRLVRGRSITTHGDRERKELDTELYENFFDAYLRNVAGWKVE